VRFVCDGSNSSARDNTRKMTQWQSGGRWRTGLESQDFHGRRRILSRFGTGETVPFHGFHV
jgi:hypothetical protein